MQPLAVRMHTQKCPSFLTQGPHRGSLRGPFLAAEPLPKDAKPCFGPTVSSAAQAAHWSSQPLQRDHLWCPAVQVLKRRQSWVLYQGELFMHAGGMLVQPARFGIAP